MKTILPGSRIATSAIVAISLLIALSPATGVAKQEDRPKAKAWLGVAIKDVTEKLTKANSMSDETGAYVSEVVDRSPADSAGIEEGDVIIEFGQKKIDHADDLLRAVEKSKVGDKVNVVVLRKGEEKNIQVVLSKYPRRREFVQTLDGLRDRIWMIGNRSAQGMQLMELNDQLGEYFGAPNGTGILVEKVRKGSRADKAGIKAGDVLLKIGKRTIDDLEDVPKAFTKYDDGDKVDVEVLRKGATKTLSLEFEADGDSSMFEIFRHKSPDTDMFRRPPFEENFFELPRWNGQEYRIDLRDLGPNEEILRQNMGKISKQLREHRQDLEKSIQQLKVRTV